MNTCFQRELGNIAWNLETGDFKLENLQKYLESMYRCKRLLNLYVELVKEAQDTCKVHGRAAWNGSQSKANVNAAKRAAHALNEDFESVASRMEKNRERVGSNLHLFVALMAVAESRTAIANANRIEALTVIAIVLLPFHLVASILNINGNLAVGGPRHYVFWAVSTPPALLLLVLYLLYSRLWSSA